MKKAEPPLNKIELLNLFKNLRNQGSKLLDSGKYEETAKALPYFLDALSISEKLYDNRDNKYTADILHAIGYVYEQLGGTDNNLKALDFYQRGLAMRQDCFGDVAHTQIAESLDSLGEVYRILGGEVNKSRSVEFATKALEMQQKLHQGQAHPDVIDSLCTAADAYKNLGNDENLGKSLSLLEQALDMAKSLYGERPNVQTAIILNSIAIYYGKLGDIESINKALYNLQKSLAIHQELNGYISSDVALVLGNMGGLYQTLANLDAENKQKYLRSFLEYAKKAFSINQELYGHHIHPSLAESMQNLSLAYLRLGGTTNMKQAYQLQKQALKMCQELYPNDHPKILKCLNNLNYIISKHNLESYDDITLENDKPESQQLSAQIKDDAHLSSQNSVLQDAAKDATNLMGQINDENE